MKLFVLDRDFHVKNKEGLHEIIKHLGISATWSTSLQDLTPYDVVYSPSVPIDGSKWPQKKFLFGPHFGVYPSVFPTINSLSPLNSVYLQPSDWVRDLFAPHVRVPVHTFPFPVAIDKIQTVPSRPQTNKVLVYCKMRNPAHYTAAMDLLRANGFDPIQIVYGSYKQADFLSLLRAVRFAVWVGSHESQGFALNEALASNTPVLVWNVRTLADQWMGGRPAVPATTCAYWDRSCGEVFETQEAFQTTLDLFLLRLDMYEPRAFIEHELSVAACAARFQKLIQV
jgi:glycosyltransferase involved in cell wall biosynthesis